MQLITKDRENWIDSYRGVAIVVTMYVHFMHWFLQDFSGWNFIVSGDDITGGVQFVRYIEGYLRIGWLGPFVVSWFYSQKAQSWDLSWYFKRFMLLVIAPTVIWSIYSQEVVFRWEIIQSLFIFNVLTGILVDISLKYRLVIYALVIGLCIYVFPFRNELASQNIFWQILVGGSNYDNYFPLLYGLPGFFWIFETFYNQFRVDPKGKKGYKFVALSGIVSTIVLIGLFFMGKTAPNHYPPALIEYFASFWLLSVLYLVLLPIREKVSRIGLLTLIGRYTWIHFMGHLVIGGILFEGRGYFLHSLDFLGANILAISLILALWIINILVLKIGERRDDKKHP